MARATIRVSGQHGIVPDLPQLDIPPTAWTRLENVQLREKYIVRGKGEQGNLFGTPSVVPHYLFPAPAAAQLYWLYTDLDKVYAYVGGTHTDITKVSGDYTGDLTDKWMSTWLTGVMILNNGVDNPQQWNPMEAATKLTDLSNWPVNTTAKVMRGFRNYLVAGNVTKTSENYPTLIKWSAPADPGTVPSSWDETDPATQAGEYPLSETSGEIVDMAVLGRNNTIYKKDAIIMMSWVGGQNIFRFDTLSSRIGLLASNCVKEFMPGHHVALTHEGDVIHVAGNRVQSIATARVRREIQTLLDSDNRENAFVALSIATKEVLIFLPTGGSVYCNKVYIWNYETDAWVTRDCSDILDAREGFYDATSVSDAWDDATENWEDATRVWEESLSTSPKIRLLGAFPTDNDVRLLQASQKLGSQAYSSVIERRQLPLLGTNGRSIVDPQAVKLVTEIWPLVEAPRSINMKVYVGMQDVPEGDITWNGPYDFDPTTDEKVDVLLEGKYPAVRFVCDDEVDWKFYGYHVEVHDVGRYF